MSILGDLDNVTYVISIDFDEADVDNYRAVTVACKGTGTETRFASGTFPIDYEGARLFAIAQVNGKVSEDIAHLCVSADSRFYDWLESNTKYGFSQAF